MAKLTAHLKFYISEFNGPCLQNSYYYFKLMYTIALFYCGYIYCITNLKHILVLFDDRLRQNNVDQLDYAKYLEFSTSQIY